jgi:hypothetical protein
LTRAFEQSSESYAFAMTPHFRVVLAATGLFCGLFSSPVPAAVKKMFVSSASGTGKLETWPAAGGASGVAAGDAICQALASEAQLENPEDFVAWLSTISSDAYCRVAGFAGKVSSNCDQAQLPDAGPWTRVDGRPFSRNLLDLTGDEGHTLYPPNLDESGNLLQSGPVLTGTESTGVRRLGGDCADWSVETESNRAQSGVSSAGYIWWTEYSPNGSTATDCSDTGRIYCFERGVGDPLPALDDPGALMFVTSESGLGDIAMWPRSGGLSGLQGADLVCQSLATDAHLPGPSSFVAYLSDSSTDAIDRITVEGPFRRVDGVIVASQRNDLAAGVSSLPSLLADIELDDLGVPHSGSVATGTDSLGNATENTCLDWAGVGHNPRRTSGLVNDSTSAWVDAGDLLHCDTNFRFYCVSNVVVIFADSFESGDTGGWSD